MISKAWYPPISRGLSRTYRQPDPVWTSIALIPQSQATQYRSNDAENECQEEDRHTNPESPVGSGVPPVVPDAFEISRW